MKKVFLWIAAIALLTGCAKEKDTNTVALTNGKTYTITATIDNPETRTTAERFQDANTGSYKYSFKWETGEHISVVPTNANKRLLFDLVNAESGTFSYTSMGGDEPEYTGFGLAVTPAEALLSLEPTITDYDIFFSGSYRYGHSNAIMVAGASSPSSDGSQKFQFEHIAALVKVTYKNVPAGTLAMVFEADHNIKGTFHFTSATGISASNDAFTEVEQDAPTESMVMFDEALDASLASAEFFIPIPIGQYQTFQARLVGEDMETIPGSERSWTASAPFSLNCADVVACPEVEYQEPDYSGEWILVGTANDQFYACPAYTANKNNIPGVEVTVDGDIVSSDNATLKMTISKVSSGEYQGMYTIKDANDLYLYAPSTTANHLKGGKVSDPSNMAANHYWSISSDGDGGLSVVASKATGYKNVLQMNPNSGEPLFACYGSANNSYSNIKLYSYDNALITRVCDMPTISFDGTHVSIETTTPGATIYYTLDETDPTLSSTVYTEPFALSETKTVKAMAVAEGYDNSDIATELCVIGEGNPTVYPYVFTSRSWAATMNGGDANWISGKEGYKLDERGIQVTQSYSGANATSPVSFNAISNITITLAKSSSGVGSVKIMVGNQEVATQSTFTTSATEYSFDVDNLNGNVTIVVNCSTNSIYVKGITITAKSIGGEGGESDGTEVTFEAGIDNCEEDGTLIVKDGVTISTTGGNLGLATEYRIFSGYVFTVSAPSGKKITRIDFTYTQNKFSTVVGALTDDGEWTGQANSIDFSTVGGQVRVTKIVVTYQ